MTLGQPERAHHAAMNHSARRPAPELPARSLGARAFWESVTRNAAAQINKATVVPTGTADLPVPLSKVGLAPSFAPNSIMFTVADRAAQFDFATSAQHMIPAVKFAKGPIFTREGEPMIVVQGQSNDITHGPSNKFTFAAIVSAELLQHGGDVAREAIRVGLMEAVALPSDTVFLDTNAAVPGLRDAGMLNNVVDLGATGAVVGFVPALVSDLGKIVGAMGAGGIATNDVMFLANDADAIKIIALTNIPANRVFGTPAIPAHTLIGIAPRAIAFGFDGDPTIEASDQGVVHMEDTTPLDISSVGSPNVVAAQVISLWQSNLIALRLRMRCSWTKLNPAAVQRIDLLNW